MATGLYIAIMIRKGIEPPENGILWDTIALHLDKAKNLPVWVSTCTNYLHTHTQRSDSRHNTHPSQSKPIYTLVKSIYTLPHQQEILNLHPCLLFTPSLCIIYALVFYLHPSWPISLFTPLSCNYTLLKIEKHSFLHNISEQRVPRQELLDVILACVLDMCPIGRYSGYTAIWLLSVTFGVKIYILNPLPLSIMMSDYQRMDEILFSGCVDATTQQYEVIRESGHLLHMYVMER